jgi:hypothetical protein
MISTGAMITNDTVHYSIVGACALGAMVLACVLSDFIIIVTTAFVGSYMLVRGVSFFAGGYPDEFDFARKV